MGPNVIPAGLRPFIEEKLAAGRSLDGPVCDALRLLRFDEARRLGHPTEVPPR